MRRLGIERLEPRLLLSADVLAPLALTLSAEADDITLWDEEIAVFNQIATPDKRLFLCRDTSHMTLYSNKSRLQILAEEARSFLVEQLGVG